MLTVVFYLICLVICFALTVIISRFLIPILRSHKMGQKILDVGPRWHKSKEGTPTMGGLAFIIASFPAALFAVFMMWYKIGGGTNEIIAFAVTYIMAAANGAIGIFDDYVKLMRKQNEGLSAKQKYLLQLIVAGLYLFVMTMTGMIDTSLYIPYIGVEIELGILYYVFALLLITGIINAVNLTDGIDGLASSVTFVAAAFFSVVSFAANAADPDMGLASMAISAITVGACIGFLVYNFYPARVFMGDTGSLFLGGLVIGMAFLSGNPLIVVVVGIIYIIETASVMLQVTYFKLTHGKRLFKMSPIHHHFEKCGWNEIKIVSVFSSVTMLACLLAWFGR